MLAVSEQLAAGRLVCPVTQNRLHREGDFLITEDGAHRYRFEDAVPILVADRASQVSYRQEQNGAMFVEYGRGTRSSSLHRLASWLARAGGDFRSAASERAFRTVVADQPADALCLAVGGGPRRVHPNLVNLNLDHFENVDVVADAHSLPYANGSVDAIHCEAVLEHLERPEQAVAEMFRVLMPRGQAFFATPFLQPFHAYPNHFQNFTLVGHNRLFERAGFAIHASGTCVGPTFALTDLISVYLRTYLPTWLLSRSLSALAKLALLPFRPLDRWLERSPDSHLLASSVYAHLVKP